jgi:phospho-N-acetylmuramoyl-pentapeptide-transferase
MFLNAPPAKIFMGDVGALPFGATFGVLFAHTLISQSENHSLTYVVAVLVATSLIFILELALVPMQLFWVKVFKRRLIPASPVHHSFEKLGWPETRITAVFLLAQFILTMIGMSSALGRWWLL